jgi:hypothetical protein
MASAAVFLGLKPTILAVAGSTLAETTLLSARRPLLAFLLAMGSPSVPPLRAFHHEDVPKMLERRKGGLGLRKSSVNDSTTMKAIIITTEFALALAAIVNVVLVSYELGMKTILTFGDDVWFLPLLWTVFTGVPHRWGCMVFRQDVKMTSPPSRHRKSTWERIRLWAHVNDPQHALHKACTNTIPAQCRTSSHHVAPTKIPLH